MPRGEWDAADAALLDRQDGWNVLGTRCRPGQQVLHRGWRGIVTIVTPVTGRVRSPSFPAVRRCGVTNR